MFLKIFSEELFRRIVSRQCVDFLLLQAGNICNNARANSNIFFIYVVVGTI